MERERERGASEREREPTDRADVWLLGWVSVLSFNVWQSVRIGHWGLFEGITDLATNILLPIGGLGLAVFVGWRLQKSVVLSALGVRSAGLGRLWYGCVRYGVVLAILCVLCSAWSG